MVILSMMNEQTEIKKEDVKQKRQLTQDILWINNTENSHYVNNINKGKCQQ